ncbi:MAG: hypothetical protein RMM17_10450 [Acidobacteriota bacterium]|nr:hypothetical protein [Blastocatellia bacterium]MDW8413090.1 hypothetical protein [Acidobacteriota bacterium]
MKLTRFASLLLLLACSEAPNELASSDQSLAVPDKVQERVQKLTQELKRQRAVLDDIPKPERAVFESFDRNTTEKEILSRFDKPTYVRGIKVNKFLQKIFYYSERKYAIWLWKEGKNYFYRATVSLNHGKLDLPLHNVMTEEELRLTAEQLE